MSERIDIVEVAKNLDVASFCDGNKGLRVVDSRIRLLSKFPRFIGLARLVVAKGDFLSVLKEIHDAEPGSVIVVASGGDVLACGGELFASEAKRKGLSAIIVDGYYRDAATVKNIEFPVYGRGFTPMAGTANRIFVKPTQVSFGGITIRENEVVFGDEDGIVVMSYEEFIALVPTASDIQRREQQVLAEINSGKSLLDLTNFDEHVNELQKTDTKLTFNVD